LLPERAFKQRFVVEGEEVGYDPNSGRNCPEQPAVILGNLADGRNIDLVFKKSACEMKSWMDKRWEVIVECDCRLTAAMAGRSTATWL